MASGVPNPRSLANLRPPWQKGQRVAGGGNPWLARANQVREDLWKAAPPETRAAMAKMLVELALGVAEEPVFDADGVPVYCPDGSQKTQPLPPARRAEMQRWAFDTWLKCIGGSFQFKSIEATIDDSRETDRSVLIQAVMVLADRGMADLIPPRVRELVEHERRGQQQQPDNTSAG